MKSAEEHAVTVATAMAMAQTDRDEDMLLRTMVECIRAIQADALEAAAKENDKAAEFEEANEHDFDSVALPMHAAAALKTVAAAIRKLKPKT